MPEIKKWEVQQMTIPEDTNIIIGHSHFIKTVEDLYEALATSSPTLEFGIAFCEASGVCLIRTEGNAQDLVDIAVENARKLNSGHAFVVMLRKGYPINVLNRIKNLQEVCSIFAATANPLQVVIAETDQGRGIMGVVDGFPTKGIEKNEDIRARKAFLREITQYKR